MFGGRFGGKCTQDRHFFDEDATLLQGTRGPDRSAQEAATAAAWPADAARNLRRRDRLRSAPSDRRTDALHRRLVEAFRRSGGARCFQHRPRAAIDRILDGRATFSRTGGSAKADLLAHACGIVDATGSVGRRAPGRTARGSTHHSSRGIRNLRSDSWTGPTRCKPMGQKAGRGGIIGA